MDTDEGFMELWAACAHLSSYRGEYGHMRVPLVMGGWTLSWFQSL